MKSLLVKDWMTTDVITVEPKTPMLEAHRLMRSKKIRRVPVVSQGGIAGIITRSDVREAEPSQATSLNVWEIHYLLNKLEVKDVMSKAIPRFKSSANFADFSCQPVQSPKFPDGYFLGMA